MNVSHYVGIVAIVGIGLAVAPAVNAESTHGAFAVRLGVGVPLDNNMRDWKNVDVISGFSYFMNHSAGTSTMTGIDVDTQLHTKHGWGMTVAGATTMAPGLAYTGLSTSRFMRFPRPSRHHRQPALPILVAKRWLGGWTTEGVLPRRLIRTRGPACQMA